MKESSVPVELGFMHCICTARSAMVVAGFVCSTVEVRQLQVEISLNLAIPFMRLIFKEDAMSGS
ncbi:unnamed protein product [Brassica rapa subsp. trilocularis]